MTMTNVSNVKDKDIVSSRYDKYLLSLLAGDKANCRQIVHELLAENVSIKTLYLDLFQRSMYEIGELWRQGKLSIALEHLATTITDSLIHHVYPILYSRPRVGRKAVVSCVPGETHQIGAKMITDIFELYGWDAFYLGINMPVPELVDFITRKQPQVVGLSLSIEENLVFLEDALQQLQATFPDIPVVAGGQGFTPRVLEVVKKYPNLNYMDSLLSLETFIIEY
jgi:methanogenic corrinoid protein MtbC1